MHSDSVNIAAAEESTPGVLPTSNWRNLEADAIGDPGPQYTKQARNPFTITRQLRRPFVAGLDCALTLEVDAIKDHIDIFGEAMFKADWKHNGGTGQSLFRPSAVTDGGGSEDSFVVAAAGNLANGTIIVTRGFANPENNGTFVTTGTSTTTAIKVATGTLVAEANPPDNATLDVAGFQFAAGDLEIDSDGNLITTSKDLRDLGLHVGQMVWLPSAEEQDPPYVFANPDYYGSAKVVAIAQNKITLERRSWTVGAPDDGAGKTIRLLFGRWIRNVARGHADENLVTHSFEITYPTVGDNGTPRYEYLKGYTLNAATFQFPLEGKVSMQLTFIGKEADDPTDSRASGASDATDCVTGLAMSTSSDIKRLSVANVDESGLMTDFAELSLVLNNNVTAVKAVGHLGNRFTPIGTFEAQVEGDAYFVTPEIVAAVSDNRIVRFLTGGRNDDFGVLFDVPSAASMSANKTIAKGELVRISSQVSGFMDGDEGYTAGMTVFPWLPTRAPGLET